MLVPEELGHGPLLADRPILEDVDRGAALRDEVDVLLGHHHGEVRAFSEVSCSSSFSTTSGAGPSDGSSMSRTSGFPISPAGDGEHLLRAAAQRARPLVSLVREMQKQLEDALRLAPKGDGSMRPSRPHVPLEQKCALRARKYLWWRVRDSTSPPRAIPRISQV